MKHLPAVVLFRIDERLIHGQVVTAWVGHTKARQILVIDDNAAADSLMSSILKMAAPPGITVTVASVGEGRRLLAGAGEDDNTIVIMKNPQEAARLLIGGPPALPPEVNMGNAGMAPGRSKLTASVYLDPAGIDALKAIAAAGRTVYFQTIPADTRYRWDDIKALK